MNEPARFSLNLSDNVLLAIGSVSAQWATLEYYLARVSHSCCDRYKNAPSKLSKSVAFLERRNAFVEAFMWQNVPEAAQQVATELADKIQAVENSRHKIIHRMANEYTDDFGDPLPAPYDSVLILRDHSKHFFAERMSVGEITDIASEIAHINARMVNLYFYLWGHVRDP